MWLTFKNFTKLIHICNDKLGYNYYDEDFKMRKLCTVIKKGFNEVLPIS